MSNAVLLSGGIDSIALTYWRRPEYAITVNYGQSPAFAELEASKKICSVLEIEHLIIDVDCSSLGSGDLLSQKPISLAPSTEWWPYRNQLLVTLASMKAIQYNIQKILVGSVSSDGFHKDGTANFYSLLSALTQYQEGGIEIEAPAINLSSVQLVMQSGIRPELLYYAHSCHKGNIPCSHCRGCNKYTQVIQELEHAGWKKS